MEDTIETQSFNGRSAFVSTRWINIRTLVIIVLLVGGLAACRELSGSPLGRGSSALVEAFRERRVIEPRLSGGFKAGEFRPWNADRSNIDFEKLAKAGELIRDSLANGDLSAQLPYGRLLLTSEDPREALKYLHRAVASAPESTEAHNDLGVGLLQAGKLENALDEFEAALKHQPNMPEASFNRALCCQRLLLGDTAAAEYSHFLEVEHDKGWQDEARRRFQETSAPLVPREREAETIAAFDKAIASGNIEEAERIAHQNLQVMIKHASERLPREYLRGVVEERPQQAERALSGIQLIGRRLAEERQDTSVADLLHYLRELPVTKARDELGLLDAYIAAENLTYKRFYAAAQSSFEQLGKDFASRDNDVFEYFSRCYVAFCQCNSNQLANAEATLKGALSIEQKHTWPYRRAQYLIQLGLLYSRLGQDSLAIKSVEQARVAVRGMPLEAYAFQYLSNAYSNLGDIDKAISLLRESTKLYLESMPMLDSLASNYLNIADLYRRRGGHGLALLYASQALSLSESAADNKRAAQVSAFMAVEHSRLNEVGQAEAELSSAFAFINKVEAKDRSYAEGVVLTFAGEMARKIDVSRSLEFYSRAESVIEGIEGKELSLLEVLRGRAKTYIEAKQFSKAQADLERAVSVLEDYRKRIDERENRSSFLDASQGIFDVLVGLSVDAFQSREQAFDFSEESRARTLLDESLTANGAGPVTGQTATPLTLPEIQTELPVNLRLVIYSVTESGTYIFTITKSKLEVVKSLATIEILDPLVDEYVASLKNRTPLDELSANGKRLYKYLIEPIASQLSDGERLCIVPDKALHFLPFTALLDEAGQFLIRRHILTYAPSATVLARCIMERRAKGMGPESALAIGDPKFDRERFPKLQGLPDTEREATESAKFYSSRLVLNSADATKSRVTAALKEFSVAHFAAHVLVDDKSPWLAALVLASDKPAPQGSQGGDQPGNGLLYINEIYGMSLPQTRLVVLSACQSALGQYYRGEGIVSLVHPFLALRVPMVVASLWSIDSQGTADLMIEFHRNRTERKKDAGEALRDAQIQLLDGDRFQHPFYWAPFIAVGSDN